MKPYRCSKCNSMSSDLRCTTCQEVPWLIQDGVGYQSSASTASPTNASGLAAGVMTLLVVLGLFSFLVWASCSILK